MVETTGLPLTSCSIYPKKQLSKRQSKRFGREKQ